MKSTKRTTIWLPFGIQERLDAARERLLRDNPEMRGHRNSRSDLIRMAIEMFLTKLGV